MRLCEESQLKDALINEITLSLKGIDGDLSKLCAKYCLLDLHRLALDISTKNQSFRSPYDFLSAERIFLPLCWKIEIAVN